MTKVWKIIRDDSFIPIPGSSKIVKDVPLALEPVPNDVLQLELPENNLEGNFLVVRRVISDVGATLVVRAFEE
jgi:hypothetical protein